MRIRNLILFFSLVGVCLAASSIHLHPTSQRLYQSFQRYDANGQMAKAEVGYRYLAQKLPYTIAGIRSAKMVVNAGESPVNLMTEVVVSSFKRTRAAEWMILVSALLVTTVFVPCNILPSIVLLPFVVSGAGLFHLSHPMLSNKSAAIESFLAINPYVYVALTLLIITGYARKRWLLSGHQAFQSANSGGELSLMEGCQITEMNIQKLQVVQQLVAAQGDSFKSAPGRHYISEIDRLLQEWEREHDKKQGALQANIEELQEEIASAEDAVANAQDEIRENHQLLKAKVINRKEFKSKKQQEEATVTSKQQNIREAKVRIAQAQRVRRRSMLLLGRWDVFGRFMDAALIAPETKNVAVVVDGLEKLPSGAREEAKNRDLLRRKSARLGEKLANLEATRGKIAEKKYDSKHIALAAEKSEIDRELSGLERRIETNVQQVRNKIEQINRSIDIFEEELRDMKRLSAVRGCFPDRVNARLGELPQIMKVSMANRAVLQQVERTYAAGG